MPTSSQGDRQVLVPFSTTRSKQGMVASIDQLASGAGVAMLRAGGSAADAAVAASAVLAVTAQHTCGMGGDIWALVHHTPGEPPAALNASGRAGSGADAQRMRNEGHTVMPLVGHPSSVTVPGCVDGWLALHDRFGKLPLSQVLQPAIDLAGDGFPLSQAGASATKQLVNVPNADDYFPDQIAGGAAGGVGGGAEQRQLPRTGTLIRRPGVAQALSDIVAAGRSGFYEGTFGEDLLKLGAEHSNGHNNEYHTDDLTSSLADWVEPIQTNAWGHRIWTVPPNSQGYLTLAAAWIADQLELPTDIDNPQALHLLAEAAKQAAYDRIDVLHEHADGNELISPERLQPRLAAVSLDSVSKVPTWMPRSGDTNYLAAVDADRMGVSLIQSNAAGWGSLCFTERGRIALHNRGIGFSLEPGHPAEYGPGRRPPHTLAPALVQTPDGQLRAVIGTMGGDNQPQVVLQLLARLLHGGATAAEAIAARRWYWSRPAASLFETWTSAGAQQASELQGSAQQASALELVLEGGTSKAGLVGRGHNVRTVNWFEDSFGHAHVITVEENRGILTGASDPRMRTSAALGY